MLLQTSPPQDRVPLLTDGSMPSQCLRPRFAPQQACFFLIVVPIGSIASISRLVMRLGSRVQASDLSNAGRRDAPLDRRSSESSGTCVMLDTARAFDMQGLSTWCGIIARLSTVFCAAFL